MKKISGIKKTIMVLSIFIGLGTVMGGLFMIFVYSFGDPPVDYIWKRINIGSPSAVGVFFLGLAYLVLGLGIGILGNKGFKIASDIILGLSWIHIIGFILVQALLIFYDLTNTFCFSSFLLLIVLDILVIWFTFRYRALEKAAIGDESNGN